jgi:serine kinase of HPr protein (carbohydrate metabolism regulator)
MTGEQASDLVHATAIELRCGEASAGVLLTGPPGSGKSSVAFALIDQPGHGLCPAGPVRARLVSDDQVRLMQQGPGIVMTPPAGLAGLLEVRGIGIVRHDNCCASARLAFVVDHQPAAQQQRLPEAATTGLLDLPFPLYRADFAAAGAAGRIRLLAQLHWGQLGLHG